MRGHPLELDPQVREDARVADNARDRLEERGDAIYALVDGIECHASERVLRVERCADRGFGDAIEALVSTPHPCGRVISTLPHHST